LETSARMDGRLHVAPSYGLGLFLNVVRNSASLEAATVSCLIDSSKRENASLQSEGFHKVGLSSRRLKCLVRRLKCLVNGTRITEIVVGADRWALECFMSVPWTTFATLSVLGVSSDIVTLPIISRAPRPFPRSIFAPSRMVGNCGWSFLHRCHSRLGPLIRSRRVVTSMTRRSRNSERFRIVLWRQSVEDRVAAAPRNS